MNKEDSYRDIIERIRPVIIGNEPNTCHSFRLYITCCRAGETAEDSRGRMSLICAEVCTLSTLQRSL
jgi:hypothetical protein